MEGFRHSSTHHTQAKKEHLHRAHEKVKELNKKENKKKGGRCEVLTSPSLHMLLVANRTLYLRSPHHRLSFLLFNLLGSSLPFSWFPHVPDRPEEVS